MRHALLLGVADETPQQVFRPGPSLDAIAGLLRDLGGWTITRIEGREADRDTILSALESLAAAVEPDDCVLLYCVGHGGVVHIHDLPPPLGGRSVFYLSSFRSGDWRFEGVLDIELSLLLARVDRICGNVTVLIDSCYSAGLVRGPAWDCHESPTWLRELATRLPDPSDCDALLHPSSHPSIVRLAGSSSQRASYADRLDDGDLGRLTSLICEVVREAELRIDRLTWDALAHRVREQAIWRLGCEEQWVSLAGPRSRLRFSTREGPLARTVAFVPRESGDGGWIRAGALQGVQIGEEWTLTELTLDEQLQPRTCARLRVTEVDLNRALLEPIAAEPGARSSARSLAPGTTALLTRAATREAVWVDGPLGDGRGALRETVERSAWLSVAERSEAAFASMRSNDDAVEVTPIRDGFAGALFVDEQRGRGSAIERVDDWARARRLLDIADARASTEWGGPLTLIVDHERGPGSRAERLALDRRHRVCAGDRVRLTVRCGRTPDGWFVCPILIDVAGRPRLLEGAEPDGRELVAGEIVTLGDNPHRRQQGVELSWPTDVVADRARPLTIIVLASRRPIALGHLVALTGSGIPSDVPRRARTRLRGHRSEPRPQTGPELATDWTAWVLRLELDPLDV
jgi:hypothetical protein